MYCFLGLLQSKCLLQRLTEYARYCSVITYYSKPAYAAPAYNKEYVIIKCTYTLVIGIFLKITIDSSAIQLRL